MACRVYSFHHGTFGHSLMLSSTSPTNRRFALPWDVLHVSASKQSFRWSVRSRRSNRCINLRLEEHRDEEAAEDWPVRDRVSEGL